MGVAGRTVRPDKGERPEKESRQMRRHNLTKRQIPNLAVMLLGLIAASTMIQPRLAFAQSLPAANPVSTAPVAGEAPASQPATPDSIPTKLSLRDARLGVATHFEQGWDHEKIMPLIVQSGLGWIRDELYWAQVEKNKGVYLVPEKELRWIKAAHGHGLKLLLVLNGGNGLYADRYDPEACARFAAEMARQLKDDVDCLEVLNEPHNFGYTKYYGGTWNGVEADGKVGAWVGRYVTLLNTCAAAVKDGNPKMKVIGLGCVTPVNYRQIEIGLIPAVDGIADHPYSFQTVPEIIPFGSSAGLIKRDGVVVADVRGTFASFIRGYRAQSEKHHGPKEIWLTEWGYSTFQPRTPGLYAGFTEDAQAKYIVRGFLQHLGLGVDVSILYDFKDDGTNRHELQHHFGLVEFSLHPKPAYAAVCRLTQATADLHVDKSVEVNVVPTSDHSDPNPVATDPAIGKQAAPGTIPTYAFRDSAGRAVVAIWSAERAGGDLAPRMANVTIRTGRPVSRITSLDLLTGTSSEMTFKQAAGGAAMLDAMTVPDSPILLTLD